MRTYQNKAWMKTNKIQYADSSSEAYVYVDRETEIVYCNTISGPLTLELVGLTENWDTNYKLTILDYGTDGTDGVAGTNPITIVTSNVITKINSLDSIKLSENGGSLIVRPVNNRNWIVEGSRDAVIDISYSELYSAITNGNLIPGAKYRLLDYKSVNFLNGWTIANDNPTPNELSFNPREIYTGENEVLLLEAISETSLSPIAHSENYPEDILEFQAYTNKLGVNIESDSTFGIFTGAEMPDASIVNDFELKWDGTNVYFDMPIGYPALFGHYFYLYCEFTTPPAIIGEVNGILWGFTGSLTPGTYLSVTGTTGGGGTGATFNVYTYPFYIDVEVVGGGQDYQIGDTITISPLDSGASGGLTITVNSLVSGSPYYQDGVFEPLTPGIARCQYPDSSNNPFFTYPKEVSRLEVVEDGSRVVLLDLTEADYNNYDLGTLYVETVHAIGDAYGWVTKRNDTQRRISVPFDFRGRKYRRYEVDISAYYPTFSPGYYGLGDDWMGQGTTGNFSDFKCFNADSDRDNYDIEWNDLGGPNMAYFCGLNDNNVFYDTFRNNTIGAYFRNNHFFSFGEHKIGDNCFGNTGIGGWYGNNIAGSFFNNKLINCGANTINYSFNNNILGDVLNNHIGESFQSNTVAPSVDPDDSTIQYNTILDLVQFNQFGAGSFRRNEVSKEFSNFDLSLAFHVYQDYDCKIFKASNGDFFLSYYDGTSPTLTIVPADS